MEDYHKNPISIDHINTDKGLIFNKSSFGINGFEYFIGCKDNGKIKSLCIMLPKMSGYIKRLDETKWFFYKRL